MANKNNNTIFWIIGIVILFIVISNPQFLKQEEGVIGLTPHYYKDGVEVFSSKGFFGFSVVTPPGGSYDQIAFEISGTNTGPPIELKIVDASPQVFKDALPTTTQTLAGGESKILWTSALMDTEQFEAVSPINFWIRISGKDSVGALVYREKYSGDISFEPDPLTSTQSFFGGLFSIISIGGQTYHYDKGQLSGVNTFVTITEYTGSGYFTGITVFARLAFSCRVFIDGFEYLNEGAVSNDVGQVALYSLSNNNLVRFDSSLKVECKPSSTQQGFTSYQVTYMVD